MFGALIVNPTDVGEANIARDQVGAFLRQYDHFRYIGAIPWNAKGVEMDHSVLKFRDLAVNFFDQNMRNDPLFLIQGKRGSIAEATDQQQFLGDPPVAIL